MGLPSITADHKPIAAATAPADPTDTAVDRLSVDAALTALPEAFRAAVVLRDVSGFSYAEIGEILRIPPGTVRSRIARGRARLADALRDPPEPSAPQSGGARWTGNSKSVQRRQNIEP